MSDSGSWAPPEGGGSEPPPPPPPPEALGQWAPIERPGSSGGGWAPPPSPPRRAGIVIIAAVGVVLLLVGLAAVGLIAVRDGEPSVVETDAATEVARPDSQLDRELAAVLTTIDGAERRMISFQDRALAVLGADPEGFGGEVSAEAGDAAQDLIELREDLVLHARDGGDELEGIRAIRDTYRVHLEAWIAYTEAVRDDPVLIRPDNPESEPYWADIGSTADEFVRAVRTGMPEDAPQELRDRAEFILERGFTGGENPGELV